MLFQKVWKIVPFFLLSVLLLIVLIFFHLHGVIDYDEGYILNSSLNILHGQTIYKDFDFAYTPFQVVITWGFLKLLGVSIFAGRMSALFISLLSVIGLYLLFSFFTKNKLLIFLLLFLFVGWGPSHVNFPWPTMTAICFFIYILVFYLAGISSKKDIFIFLSGLSTFFLFLTKQNFGGMIFLIMFFYLLLTTGKNKSKQLFFYLFAFCLASAIFLVFLQFTSSLQPFIQNMYAYTIRRVFIDKNLETPFLYEGGILQRVVKLVFYTFPLWISAVAIFFLWRQNKKLLIIPISLIGTYLIGIRPTTDYDHIVPLLAISGLSLGLIIAFLKNIKLRLIFYLFAFFFVGFSYYTAYYSGYYKWQAPLASNTYFVTDPKFRVYLWKSNAEDLQQLVKRINMLTRPHEPIFLNSYYPLVYFLTDHPNATRFDLAIQGDLTTQNKYEIINALERKRIRVVLTSILNENEQSIIGKYISKNFKKQETIGGYKIFLRSS